MKVYLKDVIHIGGTVCGSEDGFTEFICNSVTANIEFLLLRQILDCGGYKITSIDDFMWNNGSTDIRFTTDLPYEEYKKISDVCTRIRTEECASMNTDKDLSP